VDLDEPDKLYASGACDPVGSGDTGACKSYGFLPHGGSCKPADYLARTCSSGGIVGG